MSFALSPLPVISECRTDKVSWRRRSKGGGAQVLAAPPVADVTLQHMMAMRRSLATVAAAQQMGLFDSVRAAPFTVGIRCTFPSSSHSPSQN